MPEHRGSPLRRRSRPTARRWPALVAIALAVSLGLSCADDPEAGPSAGGCVGPAEEPLDPGSSLHLLPNAPTVEGAAAPTSGPHVMGTTVQGVVAEPLPAAIQVGVLERGDVLVQYGPAIEGPAIDDTATSGSGLADLAGEHVVVAPNPSVDGVVATAWRHRLTCSGVDRDELDAFVDRFADQGPQM